MSEQIKVSVFEKKTIPIEVTIDENGNMNLKNLPSYFTLILKDRAGKVVPDQHVTGLKRGETAFIRDIKSNERVLLVTGEDVKMWVEKPVSGEVVI